MRSARSRMPRRRDRPSNLPQPSCTRNHVSGTGHGDEMLLEGRVFVIRQQLLYVSCEYRGLDKPYTNEARRST